MQDYRVDLEAYSGPLDLLLFLVRRDEIDLLNIPIARLTEQYLEHLKLLQQIDVNLAGEFLVMAATLLEIKSVMLLPRPETPPEDAAQAAAPAEQLDPRYELVQQLLAYKRYKEAALELDQRRQDWDARFPRRPGTDEARKIDWAALEAGEEPLPGAGAEPIEIDLDDVHVLDLCEAFARILETIGKGPARHEVVYDDTPIGLHADDILDRLAREGGITLQVIFQGRTRSEAIGLFLAMLELVRQRKVKVAQDPARGEIRLDLRPAEEQTPEAQPAVGAAGPEDAARWRDPATGELQYDWPSEEARKRAERRAQLRAARAAKGQFGAVEGEEEDVIDIDGNPPASPPSDAPATSEPG